MLIALLWEIIHRVKKKFLTSSIIKILLDQQIIQQTILEKDSIYMNVKENKLQLLI